MTSILKTLAVTLVAGAFAAIGAASAAPNQPFYPDGFKGEPSFSAQSLGAESGIPPHYRVR